MAVVVVTRFVLDRTTRRLDGGRVLLGGSPLALFRLSDAGCKVLDDVLAGRPVAQAATRLTDRLLDAGAIHPRPTGRPFLPEDVTVVIPVRDDDPSATIAAAGPIARVIVVDDGSIEPVATPGATVLRRPVNGGPAAARNTGLAAVTTPLVAFLDADCVPEAGWLDALLPHFTDDRVAAVAPRVASTSTPRDGALARYDAARSPLDLGPAEGRVRARTRVSYVPSAALVARTHVLLQSGGFDEDLRVGEDVDLVWRLDEGGLRVRYEPAAAVQHAPRPSLVSWLRQRVAYGRSAAPLSRRHPGAVAPVAVSGWSAAVWTLVAAGAPIAGTAVGLGTVAALARKLRSLDHPLAESLRLAGLGHLFAGRLLASAITRVWWPVVLGLAVVSRRVRRVLVLAAVAPAIVDWLQTRPPLDPARYTALRVLDDAAYGVGVWRGAIAERTVEPLLPDLTSWPRSSRYERTVRSAGTARDTP